MRGGGGIFTFKPGFHDIDFVNTQNTFFPSNAFKTDVFFLYIFVGTKSLYDSYTNSVKYYHDGTHIARHKVCNELRVSTKTTKIYKHTTN